MVIECSILSHIIFKKMLESALILALSKDIVAEHIVPKVMEPIMVVMSNASHTSYMMIS